MKKLNRILITCVFLLACFGCSSNEENTLDVQQNNETQTTIVEENKQEEVDVTEQDTSNEEVKEDIVDNQEEKEEEAKVLDNGANPNYDYWVTFYDHDGNILQQEAIKYGTVPTYYSDTPYYDDGIYWYKGVGWTDKWGREVKEFKPITGNTKFYAVYEKCGEVSHTVSNSDPTPAPPPYVPNCIDNTNAIVKITSVSGYGYRWILYLNDGTGYVERLDLSATSGNKTVDNLNGFVLEIGHYYHVSSYWLSGFAHLGTILSECVTPGPDHSILIS